jgi:hypothetical protein
LRELAAVKTQVPGRCGEAGFGGSGDKEGAVIKTLSVGSLRGSWLRRSQVIAILNKELSRDTPMAKQQQSFSERESSTVHSKEGEGSGLQ